jgi:DNA-binding NarL/FixJ family response regulator
MINIAIIDRNETYRKSLKTILEQVEGFRVVLESGDSNLLKNSTNIPVQVALLDISFGRDKCIELLSENYGTTKSPKTIILVMYNYELQLNFDKADTMLKSSCKKEFENRIKQILTV